MRKQELSQIYSRFFKPTFQGSVRYPAKHQKPTGTLIHNSYVDGTFTGSVRDTFGLSKGHKS